MLKIGGWTLLLALFLVGCDVPTSTDRDQARATEDLVGQANAEIGMPGITNFQERRLVRMLYELRDQEDVSTFTYLVDRNGNRHLLCESIGFGIPYAVQFSNPQRRARGGQYGYSLPQPEPNGLFMPDALSATWVMCADGAEVRPVYVEPQIIVSLFQL